MKCLIMVQSGMLDLKGCQFRMNTSATDRKKAACLVQMQDTTTHIIQCIFKNTHVGSGFAAGVFINRGNSLINNCQFDKLQGGGIISLLKSNNIFICRDSAFISCRTAGIYGQGDSAPVICSNVFMMNKCPGIVLSNRCDGSIIINEFNLNNKAIMVINNQSCIYGNRIQNTADIGIVAQCTYPLPDSNKKIEQCSPLIMRNWIE